MIPLPRATCVELRWRPAGATADGYAAAIEQRPGLLLCLTCGHLVNPFAAHVLVRDAAERAAGLDDEAANCRGLRGLLHPGDCKTLHVLEASLYGAAIWTLPPGPRGPYQHPQQRGEAST